MLEIAEDDPITCDFGDGEMNACKFCGVSWASSNIREALTPLPYKNYGLGFRAHDDDCIWVRANHIKEQH